jgi:hypothetical protein
VLVAAYMDAGLVGEYQHYRTFYSKKRLESFKLGSFASDPEKLVVSNTLREAVEPLMEALGMESPRDCTACGGHPSHCHKCVWKWKQIVRPQKRGEEIKIDEFGGKEEIEIDEFVGKEEKVQEEKEEREKEEEEMEENEGKEEEEEKKEEDGEQRGQQEEVKRSRKIQVKKKKKKGKWATMWASNRRQV